MGFNWHVNVTLEYCIPIKLDKVSLWYMLKRLAEYEAGYGKRAHDAMAVGDPMGRAAQSVVVLTDSEEYLEDEVEKEVANPTPLEKSSILFRTATSGRSRHWSGGCQRVMGMLPGSPSSV